jgi:DmsE family decaheme c-type cytochrome
MPTPIMAAHDASAGPGPRRGTPGATVLAAIAILLAGWLPAGPSTVIAQEESAPEYTRQGADTCLRCHDSAHIQSIFRTPHGEPDDAHAPFAKLQCETCHGPGGDHGARLRAGETRPPIRNFGRAADYPVAEQNAVCLNCHEGDVAGAWHGGVHDQASTSCVDCHTVHAPRDPVLLRNRQAETCYGCHSMERAEFQRAFSHPVRFGEMACSDCHAPHDSFAPALLKQATLNQTCYQCHAELRGPFLWEHPPASEDCTNCHRPHGSNHPRLLTKAAPLLCQDCHSRVGHPSVAYSGRGLPGRQPSQFVVGGSCSNCHSRVHGSNHPSGANLTR